MKSEKMNPISIVTALQKNTLKNGRKGMNLITLSMMRKITGYSGNIKSWLKMKKM